MSKTEERIKKLAHDGDGWFCPSCGRANTRTIYGVLYTNCSSCGRNYTNVNKTAPSVDIATDNVNKPPAWLLTIIFLCVAIPTIWFWRLMCPIILVVAICVLCCKLLFMGDVVNKLPAWLIILFVAIMVLAFWVGIFIALWAFVRMGGWV